jgi:cytidylate kinase
VPRLGKIDHYSAKSKPILSILELAKIETQLYRIEEREQLSERREKRKFREKREDPLYREGETFREEEEFLCWIY